MEENIHCLYRKITNKQNSSPKDFIKRTLKDVTIISYTVSVDALDTPPVDEISLEFTRIDMEYRSLNPDGSLGGIVKTGWDIHANRLV